MPPGKFASNNDPFSDGERFKGALSNHSYGIIDQQKYEEEDNIISGVASATPHKSHFVIASENDDDDDDHDDRHQHELRESNPMLDDISLREALSSEADDKTNDLSDPDEIVAEMDENSTTKERLLILLAQAGPVTISFFLGFAGTFTNLIFASHFVGDDGSKSAIFAGVSLANMFANVSCMSLLIGMSSALETLGSQHNGAKEYNQVGITLWKCIMILGLMLPFIGTVWYFTGDIFRALGIDTTVCIVIQRYIRIRSLTLPIDVINVSFEKYLMSIGVVKPSMWSNISFNISLLFLNSLFVYVLHLNYTCLAYSWVISTYFMAAVQWGLSWNEPAVQRTLQPWSPNSLKGWGQFIGLGVPGTVMLCSEWWAYEVLSLFASFKGTDAVAAQTIILQTASLVFMIPLGLGVASASLVGNAIGAKQRTLAIQIGWLAISVIVVVEIGVAAGIYFFGIYFVKFFTTDEAVRHLAEGSLTFLSVFCFFDAIQGVISGILRGTGKQLTGAAANIIAFYVIGLPLAYYLCFKTSLGINGLMLGLSGGVIFQDIVSLFLMICCESFIFPIDAGFKACPSTAVELETTSNDNHSIDIDNKKGTSSGGDFELKILSSA